ncbi:MAG: hypothetical protein PHV30_09410 [Candidatus Margulisbacteria bacterium]|nr:hypothetical protein [Candidatus Margulisiibacteriota bacterium]
MGRHKGFILLEFLFSFFVLATFLLIYIGVQTNLSGMDKVLKKEKEQLTGLRVRYLKAMTYPLNELYNDPSYLIWQTPSGQYQITVRDSMLDSGLFVQRRN